MKKIFLLLCAGFLSLSIFAQIGDLSDVFIREACEDLTKPTFEGTPERTLCEEYQGIVFDLVIGSASPSGISKSSQLGGGINARKVHVMGGFEIDESFWIGKCAILFDENAGINVSSGQTLRVEQSSLFACDDLWAGINLESRSTLRMSGSHIEDAQTAISASDALSAFMYLENNVFNRDRVGISMTMSQPHPKHPVIVTFVGNVFSCDAPLNGTTDGITEIGVNLVNIHNPFIVSARNKSNTFVGLGIGMKVQGAGLTNLFLQDYAFERNLKGIEFLDSNTLTIRGSSFKNNHARGVEFVRSNELTVEGECVFDYSLLGPSIFQPTAVQIDFWNLLPNGKVRIKHNTFTSSGNTQKGVINISSFFGESTTVDIDIYENKFISEHLNPLSIACSLNGIHSSSSVVRIEDNDFYFRPYDEHSSPPSSSVGIRAVGSKNNLTIFNNRFYGASQNISLKGSEGVNNTIIENKMYPYTTDGAHKGIGMLIQDFQNTTICSNDNFFASNVAYFLSSKNNGMIFSENTTYDNEVLGQNSLWLVGEAVIGTQTRRGNAWYYPSILQHDGNPSLPDFQNKAFIEQSQFVTRLSQGSYLHPESIIPDEGIYEDAFFTYEVGPQNSACVNQLPPPSTTEFDVSDINIATGRYAELISSPAFAWDGQRHLYHKAMHAAEGTRMPEAIAAFVQRNANTTVGKFYTLQTKMDEASMLSDDIKQAMSLASENSKIELATEPETAALEKLQEERFAAYLELQGYIQHINEMRRSKLQEARVILQSIQANQPYEQNRKWVYQAYLDAQIDQRGIYTDAQVARLQQIASLCPQKGGMTVYLARGYLDECDLAEIQKDIDACEEAIPHLALRQTLDGNTPAQTTKKGQLFPNPNTGTFHFINPTAQEGRAVVFDGFGRKVSEQYITTGKNTFHIGTTAGIYMVRIQYTDGSIETHKMVVNQDIHK